MLRRYTLVADGSSDSVLLPLIDWLLARLGVLTPVESNFAAPAIFRGLGNSLSAKLVRAMTLFPCDLLFVHRDAEAESIAFRRKEISMAFDAVARDLPPSLPIVAIVPVRMTEAWFLFDE